LTVDFFTSRLIGTVDEMNYYFFRLHDYKVNGSLVDVSAFIFIDEDWSGMAGYYLLDTIYSSIDLRYRSSESTRAVYLNKLTGAGAEFVHQWVHSYPGGMSIGGTGGGWVYCSDIEDLNLKGTFYQLFNCSAARFTSDPNMGMTYLLGTDYGLASMGSTKTGAALDTDLFNGPLAEGLRWGPAFLQWYNDAGRHDDEWHLGMVVLGDPMIAVSGDTRGLLEVMPVPKLTPEQKQALGLIMAEFARYMPLGTFEQYRKNHPQHFAR
jgi:hypothetical protein